jgi:glycosyltransferase involved in cell wall biosynthesis
MDVENFLRRIRRRYASPARIQVMTDELPEEEIKRLHARGDCYVSLCRAEGWGLGAFEAANHGKPVIMTGYGGQRDFLPEALAYLVPYTLVPVRDEMHGAGFSPEQHWARPSLPDAIRLMRHVFENREEAEARGRRLRTFVQHRFQGDRTIRKLLSVIRGEPHP